MYVCMYEGTDVENWSFVGSDVPMMNASAKEMIYEVNHNYYFELRLYEIK